MKGKKRWVCLLGGLLGALAFGYALFQGIDIGTDMVRSELLNAVSGSMKGRCDVASVSGNPIVGYRIRDLRILSGDVVVATVTVCASASIRSACCAAGIPSPQWRCRTDSRIFPEFWIF